MSAPRRFLAALFGPAAGAPELRCELRGLAPRQGPHAPPWRAWYPLAPNALDAAARTAELWAPRRDVYAGVAPRRGRRGDAAGAAVLAWLFADVDAEGLAAARALLAAALARHGLPDPAILVASGGETGGLHAYWPLADPLALDAPEDRARAAALLRRLARSIGADPACCDVARVLRVPGTLNHKRNEPRPVTLLDYSPANTVRPRVWWSAHLPPEPLAPPRPATQPVGASLAGRLAGLARWAAVPVPKGERHRQLVAAARWLAGDLALPADVVAELVHAKARASAGTEPLPEREVQEVLRWATR